MSTKQKYNFSESQMAEAFEKVLRSTSKHTLSDFSITVREAKSQIGRPDIIGIKGDASLWGAGELDVLDTKILGLLKRKSPRTKNYLLSKINNNESAIKRSLKKLIEGNIVTETKNDTYLLSIDKKLENLNIWLFELKIDNAKRAVFQAKQGKIYADYSVIVVPEGREKSYKKFEKSMYQWGIGLVTFNPLSNEVHIIQRPKKTRIISKPKKYYAISQLLVS